ncbi:MAG: UDP-N-acetylmuramoyl-L-alanyl-D-glutamate--2,6-diaminopimelate ligase [Deltaproteobacteria bacterium]|nr:UDP-N-acetylmuramoyl-L-alanyl-D-glutamate--2,6-diaminopimelate ligase [Deltaproteobacteria bacterium]
MYRTINNDVDLHLPTAGVAMNLREILETIEIREFIGDPFLEVTDISHNSKQTARGSLFVAIKGHETDGHKFIGRAVLAGAKAVICEDKSALPHGVPAFLVTNSRKALAELAGRFYGHPVEQLVLVGITGTNGKTTTAHLLESILKQAGRRPGVLGTIDCHYGDMVLPSSLTTPESLDLQRIFKSMVDDKVTHVAMEVSSHALDLGRVEGCRFAVAVFTNLSRDHLDYHGDFKTYFECKKRLFSDYLLPGDLDGRGRAVVNADDSWGRQLIKLLNRKVVTYGLERGCQVRAKTVKADVDGLSARIICPNGEFDLCSPMVGEVNIYNHLAAAAAANVLGIGLDEIKAGLEEVPYVRGRLQRVNLNGSGLKVFVDYAHTGEALKGVLNSLRKLGHRIITVFGCGGDRDRGKRPIMGEVATRFSFVTVITSDNPRTEGSMDIINQITVGITDEKVTRFGPDEADALIKRGGYAIIPDRREAIMFAVNLAEAGDIVLVAGKGHEDYQIIGKTKISFDDCLEVAQAAKQRQSSGLISQLEAVTDWTI